MDLDLGNCIRKSQTGCKKEREVWQMRKEEGNN